MVKRNIETQRIIVELDDSSMSHRESVSRFCKMFPDYSLKTLSMYVTSARMGYKTFNEYQEFLALRKGFKSRTKYAQKERYKEQDLFEMKIELFPPHKIDLLAYSSSDLIEDIEKREISGLINKSLLSLSERERQIIEQKYFYQKTFAEISEDFNVSIDRIRQIHNKSINKIRRKTKLKVALKNKK